MATVAKTKKTISDPAGGNVGLNASKISAMQNYLNTYINAVTKKITIAANTQNIQAAIKGSSAEVEVRKYIKEIDAACEKYLQDLKKYSDKLSEMANIYKANDKFTV